MFLASKVDRILHIPARRFGNIEAIHLEMTADQPYKIADKVGYAYIRDYPNIFSRVQEKDVVKVSKKAKSAAQVKTEEIKKKPVFDVVAFLNNSSTLPEEKFRTELSKFDEPQLIEVCRVLKLRMPFNTGPARRIERIVSDIKIKNNSEIAD